MNVEAAKQTLNALVGSVSAGASFIFDHDAGTVSVVSGDKIAQKDWETLSCQKNIVRRVIAAGPIGSSRALLAGLKVEVRIVRSAGDAQSGFRLHSRRRRASPHTM